MSSIATMITSIKNNKRARKSTCQKNRYYSYPTNNDNLLYRFRKILINTLKSFLLLQFKTYHEQESNLINFRRMGNYPKSKCFGNF